MACNCNRKSAAQKYNFAAQILTAIPAPLTMGSTAGLPTGPSIVDRGNNLGVRHTGLYRLTAQLAAEELDHMSRLHAQVLRLIDNQRRVDPESLPRTLAVYDHLHKRDIDQVAEIGVLQMQYKSK